MEGTQVDTPLGAGIADGDGARWDGGIMVMGGGVRNLEAMAVLNTIGNRQQHGRVWAASSLSQLSTAAATAET